MDALTYLALGLLAVLIIFFGISKITGDDDIFWHLATGKWVIEHRTIPAHDVFGLISQDQTWIPFEWGWDVVSYALYSLTGNYMGVQLLPVLIYLVIFTLLVSIMRKLKITPSLILLILLLTLIVSLDRLTPRPHVISLLGITLIIYLYTNSRYSVPRTIKRLWWLPVIFCLWTNAHPGVITGFLLLFILYLSEIVFFFAQRGKSTASVLYPLDVKSLLIMGTLVLLCAVGMMLNPQGISTFVYTYTHTQMKLLGVIREWSPPFGADTPSSGPLWAYKIMIVVGGVSIYYSIRRKDFLPILLYVAFGLFSLRAVRFMADFAIGTAIGTAAGLNEISRRYSRPLRFFVESKVLMVILILFMLFSIVTVPGNSFYDRINYYRRFGFGIDREFFSTHMMDFLKKNGIKGNVFNNLDIGGLLMWERFGEKNFIDSRNLSDDHAKEYYSILTMQPGFEEKLKRYDIDYVVLHLHDLLSSPNVMQLSLISYCSTHRDQWKLVYWDDRAFLYLKNVPKFNGVIRQYEYKMFDPYLYAFRRSEFDSLRTANPIVVQGEIRRKLTEDPEGKIANLLAQYVQSSDFKK